MPTLILDLPQKTIEPAHGAIGQVMQHEHDRIAGRLQHPMGRGGPTICVAEIAGHGIPQRHGRLFCHQVPRGRAVQ